MAALFVGTTCVTNAFGEPITPTVPLVARPLPLSAVRLTGGPLKRAQDLDAEYLLALEPDRMLAYYRSLAGLEPKAKGYGGWDADGRPTGYLDLLELTLAYVEALEADRSGSSGTTDTTAVD